MTGFGISLAPNKSFCGIDGGACIALPKGSSSTLDWLALDDASADPGKSNKSSAEFEFGGSAFESTPLSFTGGLETFGLN